MKKKNLYNAENPLFFLFTCVKEGRPYIQKLFSSLLKQTKYNFVHYIYEDGSDDPIEDLVNEYKEKASKLVNPYRVEYEKNANNIGLNMATKHCIDMCYCPYFIWIDCDNWVDENFFKELEDAAVAHKNSIYIGSNRFDVCENFIKPYFSKKQLKLAKKKKRDIEYLCDTFGFSFFAIKHSLYLEINKNNYFVNERHFFNDMQVISHCILSNKEFSFADKAYSYFLCRNDSEGNSFEYGTKAILSNYGGIYKLAKQDGLNNAEYLLLLTSIRLLKRHRYFALINKDHKKCAKLSKQIKRLVQDKRMPSRYKRHLIIKDMLWHISMLKIDILMFFFFFFKKNKQ